MLVKKSICLLSNMWVEAISRDVIDGVGRGFVVEYYRIPVRGYKLFGARAPPYLTNNDWSSSPIGESWIDF